MSSDNDSDDNEGAGGKFYHWNDWKPSMEREKLPVDMAGAASSHVPTPKKIVRKHKNWLTPQDFGLKKRKTAKVGYKALCTEKPAEVVEKENPPNFGNDLLSEWGPRLRYGLEYDCINEGAIVWNIFQVGLFGNIKLWMNQYGNIAAYADAEISNGYLAEKGFLVVYKEQLLRKLLGVTPDEWAALIEALGTSKWSLKYEALRGDSGKKLEPLEKLWFFLCKRRHLLPSVCIQMRRTGVQKLTRFLKILPKFTAEDIRTCDGREIL